MPPRAKAAAPSSRQVISRQLREVIRGRGMTAYALGQRADIDPGIIQRFLNEERDIKLDTLDRLADVLGLRLAEGSRGRGRPTRSPKAGPTASTAADQSPADGPSPPAPAEDGPPEPGGDETPGPEGETGPPEASDPDEAAREQPWWEL